MGGASTPGGDGLNVELNLVPFIDLLSSLVLFLLLGAVWIQIASMQAAVESKNGVHKSASKEVPKRVEVKITRRGYELKWPAQARMPASLAVHGAVYDRKGLKSVIASAVKDAKINGGGVSASDDVPYGEIVVAIDALKEGGLTAVGLTTE